MKECEVCGGDPAIAEIAIAMGHRPDAAFLEVRKGNRRIEELERRLELMFSWIQGVEKNVLLDLHQNAHKWMTFEEEYPDWFDKDGRVK